MSRFIGKMGALLLAVVMVVTTIGVGPVVKVKAASMYDAASYTIGTTKNGVIAVNSTIQYYKFTLTSSSKLHFTGTAYLDRWIDLNLYDVNAKELWYETKYKNSTTGLISIDNTFYLASGTYYLSFSGDEDNTGNFNFRIDSIPSNESFHEENGGSNNLMTSASPVNTDGTTYKGQISFNDTEDFYKFTINKAGSVAFKATFYDTSWNGWQLYDSGQNKLLYDEGAWDSKTQTGTYNENIYLTAGTYYLCIAYNTWSDILDYSECSQYDFSLAFSSGNSGSSSGGDSIDSAKAMQLDKSYSGQMSLNDGVDFYTFTLSAKTNLVLNISSQLDYISVKIYDSNVNQVYSEWADWNSVARKSTLSDVVSLTKGKYYLAVVQEDSDSQGSYTVSLNHVTKTNHTHDYESTWHGATYFAKGYTNYKCTICGHSYNSNYTSVLVLSTPSFYGSVKKRKAYITWSTVYGASGYQIKYSTNKKLKKGSATKTITIKGKNKTRKVIKKLKKKKRYYFKMRAYKKSGGKTVYSKWSAKKWTTGKVK